MVIRLLPVLRSASVLFKPLPRSVVTLQKATLQRYSNEFPSFPTMLGALNQQGLFLDKKPVKYNMTNFLETNFKHSIPHLNRSPLQLLTEPLSSTTLSMDRFIETENYPAPFGLLSGEINCYIEILMDVFNNQLAQKPYEALCDQENVTEREHGLQAGKISYLLGMCLGDILALLFHDIARPSISNPLHGHSNHCKEGSVILLRSVLPIDYAGYHTFAKYLLYTFTPSYRDLISDTSKYSLKIQSKDLAWELGELNTLDSFQLANTIYKIMFMRLIDDMSKVPTCELRKRLGKEPDHFDNQLIQKMLSNQITMHLKEKLLHSTNIEETVNDIKEKLDAALLLLLRARNHTTNPYLYEKHDEIIGKLLKENTSYSLS